MRKTANNIEDSEKKGKKPELKFQISQAENDMLKKKQRRSNMNHQIYKRNQSNKPEYIFNK